MIKGIVFDFDGTILDTEASNYQAWLEIYREYQVILPFALWSSTIGTSDSFFDPVVYLESKIGQRLDADLIHQKHAQLESEILRDAKPLPGVMNLLEESQKMGIILGIASSSSFEWVEDNLRTHGLRDYFKTVVTRERVTQTKPYPFLFEKAVKEMELYPYQVIAIEDSPLGVTAAKAAGIFTIAVPNSVTCHLNMDHADMQIDSLADITLASLIQQISV
jgi:putative hydrolase of the HAD superfamily